jgi:hypothetical protein
MRIYDLSLSYIMMCMPPNCFPSTSDAELSAKSHTHAFVLYVIYRLGDSRVLQLAPLLGSSYDDAAYVNKSSEADPEGSSQ